MKPQPKAPSGGVLLLVGLLLALAAPKSIESRSTSGLGRAFDSFRLPNSTVPTHYNLYLDTDIHAGIFDYTGSVQIRINILEPTSQIVLHSKRNVITKLQLRNSADLVVPVKGYEFDEEKEFLVINVGTVLQPASGSYTIDIDFTNSIDRTDQSGFYVSSYQDDQGVTRYLGLTQFESVDARTSFPCYDEPGIKTTYDIRITCGFDYHVRSNAPLLGIQLLPGGKKLSTFATTPRMQTYLVAWLVSDFVYEREVLKDPQLAVASWAEPAAAQRMSYSVDASKRFMRAMEEYFGEQYTMNKIDNVAIKNSDYAAGAMENWGLVTYADNTILFDPATQGESQQVQVVTIVGHEYTHQFFGNLLAPKWWSYLWLNEGFARLYQYYVGSISHPELNLRERFVSGPQAAAFNTDGSPTVRPMTYYTETRATISRLFDNIAYAKSASVLRMFSYALGELTFQKGLRYYIQQNKASGVVQDTDLFASLEQAAKEDAVLPVSLSMDDIFGSWSNQAGAPEVHVRREGNEFFFTQKRFYTVPQEEPVEASWWIPISYTTSSSNLYETRPAFWMPPGVSEVSHTIALEEGELVQINPLSTGYYKVIYSPELLDEMIEQLNKDHSVIKAPARARLIDDTLKAAFRDGSNYETVFQLMSYLAKETDYVPWAIVSQNHKQLQALLSHEQQARWLLDTFMARLASPLLERHGLEPRVGESSTTTELRLMAIEMACSASESCKAKAKASIAENQVPRNPTEVAIRCVGLQRQAGPQERQQLSTKLSQMLPSLQDTFSRLYANQLLTCSGDEQLVVETLVSKLPSMSETDRAESLHRAILDSGISVKRFIQQIDTELRQRKMQVNQSALARTLEDIAGYVTDESEAEFLLSIVSQLDVPSSMVKDMEQQLQANQRWVLHNVGPLTVALSEVVTV
ncbi:aminopeptidase N-like [Anopheles aquasalis]|uniref:aminopeptidase N-like n=1 Tax=Anopheles aquasalis TaxID=42839 RepID=UPI00215AD97C|nr:aminopeptidase N-like [Anopheles aquasalis]